MAVLQSLRTLQRTEAELSQKHARLLNALDSLDFTCAPVSPSQEYPLKFLVDISAFEALAGLASDLYAADSSLKAAIHRVFDQVMAFADLQRKCVAVKQQLTSIQDRLSRDTRYVQSTAKRISTILGDFRLRCHEETVASLKEVETDLYGLFNSIITGASLERLKQECGELIVKAQCNELAGTTSNHASELRRTGRNALKHHGKSVPVTETIKRSSELPGAEEVPKLSEEPVPPAYPMPPKNGRREIRVRSVTPTETRTTYKGLAHFKSKQLKPLLKQ